ncbi:hypothetical protein EDC96DRAFT_3669 [Choanephora cucurbitarum]|nr:hypothetical protein EDC96DRAFT_3669 [Choanephora cucurbitarum]
MTASLTHCFILEIVYSFFLGSKLLSSHSSFLFSTFCKMQAKIQTSDVTLSSTKSELINSNHSFQSTISLQAISLPTNTSLSFQSTADTETNKPDNDPKTLVKLSSSSNSFFNDKRKWEDSFTVTEIKQLSGNIVKASKDNGGETHVTLQQEESTVSALLHEDESSQESNHLEAIYTRKPGRKPIQNNKNLLVSDQDPRMKRKAQNRAAQRAFRERKEHYVKELEAKLKQIQDVHLITTSQLVRENQQLRATVVQLEYENCALKGFPVPFPTSSDSLPQYLNYKSPYPIIAPSLQFAPIQALPIRSNEMISPILSSDIATSTRTFQRKLSSLHKTVPKKILPKEQRHDETTIPAPLSRAPLEYNFSICTPISLRPTLFTF